MGPNGAKWSHYLTKALPDYPIGQGATRPVSKDPPGPVVPAQAGAPPATSAPCADTPLIPYDGPRRAAGGAGGADEVGERGRSILPHFCPKRPHFRPKLPRRRPKANPALGVNGAKWCKMVQPYSKSASGRRRAPYRATPCAARRAAADAMRLPIAVSDQNQRWRSSRFVRALAEAPQNCPRRRAPRPRDAADPRRRRRVGASDSAGLLRLRERWIPSLSALMCPIHPCAAASPATPRPARPAAPRER